MRERWREMILRLNDSDDLPRMVPEMHLMFGWRVYRSSRAMVGYWSLVHLSLLTASVDSLRDSYLEERWRLTEDTALTSIAR